MKNKTEKNTRIELIAALPTLASFDDFPLEAVDALYLGNPYCLQIEGNLAANPIHLLKSIELVKEHGKKAYLTTPVISYGEDLLQVKKTIQAAQEAGIDAVEAQDAGIFNLLKRDFPDIPVHLGHFINIYNEASGAYYVELGAMRLVPSYELTLNEKKEFLSIPAEIEIPVHGKLPIGMAQACLLSMEFPSRTQLPCIQQCRDVAEIVLQGWKMRCTGKSMVMAEDLTMIEYLDLLLRNGFSHFRMDFLYDEPKKAGRLARIYRDAFEMAMETNQFKPEGFLKAIRKILEDKINNGWYFGASGRVYLQEEQRVELEEHVSQLLYEKDHPLAP